MKTSFRNIASALCLTIAIAAGSGIGAVALAQTAPAPAPSLAPENSEATLKDVSALAAWTKQLQDMLANVLLPAQQLPFSLAELDDKAQRPEGVRKARAWLADLTARVASARAAMAAMPTVTASPGSTFPIAEVQANALRGMTSVLDNVDAWRGRIDGAINLFASNDPSASQTLRAAMIEGGIPILESTSLQVRSQLMFMPADHPQRALNEAVALNYDAMVITLRILGALTDRKPAPAESAAALRTIAGAADAQMADGRLFLAQMRFRVVGVASAPTAAPGLVDALNTLLASYDEAFALEDEANALVRSISDLVGAQSGDLAAVGAKITALGNLDERRFALTAKRMEIIATLSSFGVQTL